MEIGKYLLTVKTIRPGAVTTDEQHTSELYQNSVKTSQKRELEKVKEEQ